MNDLEKLTTHFISKEAKNRLTFLMHQRESPGNKQSNKKTYEPINEHFSELTNPKEQACAYARAAFELLFDYENAALIAAKQGDFKAFHAYNELAKNVGDSFCAQYDFEKFRNENTFEEVAANASDPDKRYSANIED